MPPAPCVALGLPAWINVFKKHLAALTGQARAGTGTRRTGARKLSKDNAQ